MKHTAQDIALQRDKYPHLTDEEFRFMVQQIAGREKLRDKLPTLVQQADWWFPAGLACEQCSSEFTAQYKVRCAQVVADSYDCFVDLTGGYGVDSFFLSSLAKEGHYVERDGELCRIAAHNFAAARPHVRIHNTAAEDFLQTMQPASASTLLYIDPARRGVGGSKVFRLEDCTPDVTELLPQLLAKSSSLLIKLSPMLDITAALRSLGNGFDVHVVAVHNEVKELLLCNSPALSKGGGTGAGCLNHETMKPETLKHETSIKGGGTVAGCLLQSPCGDGVPRITAVNITGTVASPQMQTLSFTYDEERAAEVQWLSAQSVPRYLYEPNAAIIKACAFRSVSARFGLGKLAPNTHLYASDRLLSDFPGRAWKVVRTLSGKELKHLAETVSETTGEETGCAILTRNYPMTAEQLRKKLRLRDGDTWYIIGARAADKPTLYLAKRVK